MSEATVSLDYGYCTPEGLDGDGFGPGELQGAAARLATVHEDMAEQRRQGGLGFMDLPHQGPDELEPILAEARRLAGLADTLVVLGIGGSARGSTAVDMALAGVQRNSFDRPPGAMRLFVADSPDPRAFGGLLDKLDLERTAFNVVSKSGSTAETMSQFMAARDLLLRALGERETARRLVFTTDPVKGNLRLLAGREPIACLSVPPHVGGRYSVLSAVGLLPLACAGHDIKALLAGAARMAERCAQPDPTANPAYMFAALSEFFMNQGRNVLVMMPYASDLLGLAQWFAQLWAESLGKAFNLKGEQVNLGQTPVAAVGPTDQHSQLQLYMEGPQDKLVCFVIPEDFGRDITIPPDFGDIEALAYLGGRGLAELVQAEAKATAAAQAAGGRPSLTQRNTRVDDAVMGQTHNLLETAAGAAGGLMGVDPLDQPGVELGKRLTYGLMGRKGFEEEAGRMASRDLSGRYVV